MAGLNKKPPVLVDEAMAYALDDRLSKAALIDLCVDMLRRVHGEGTPDIELLRLLDTDYLPPVCRERGDSEPHLLTAYERYFRRVGVTSR